ncbi:MAG TPA: efflux RND transporter periplasmic adaptor subunit [Ferruginibacter sp.]|nr:efflux RND transporter periplasmic adaptor subunit [Ferruginibacter sp.]HPH89198.1 efflux RND transporter periplasmic adaptor subunit [Ferruginibacter sp.]
MRQYLVTAMAAAILFSSCGSSKKEDNAALTEKKAALEKLKADKEKLDGQIGNLEKEIAKLDTSAANAPKTKLVAVQTLALTDFAHYIELQGKVDGENISYIAPRGGGGLVKAVLVKQGDQVKKGQLLLKLDDAIQKQQVTAARQQMEGVKTQLTLARSLYQRQNNLWAQGIGTEVQVITYKTNVTALEDQLALISEQVKLAQEQMNSANVYSDVSGVADIVNIRVGELFQGQTAAGPQIKIVNNTALKVVGNIPENYLGSVSKGTPMIIQMPDVNKTFNTTVSFVGASIDAINRGFVVESRLPYDPALKPNQIALMKVKDYAAANTIAIPLNTLQNDEKGKFVMVASTENGKLVARKRPVNIGLLNNDILEIKTGLKPGDVLITEGYAGLYEGQLLVTK